MAGTFWVAGDVVKCTLVFDVYGRQAETSRWLQLLDVGTNLGLGALWLDFAQELLRDEFLTTIWRNATTSFVGSIGARGRRVWPTAGPEVRSSWNIAGTLGTFPYPAFVGVTALAYPLSAVSTKYPVHYSWPGVTVFETSQGRLTPTGRSTWQTVADWWLGTKVGPRGSQWRIVQFQRASAATWVIGRWVVSPRLGTVQSRMVKATFGE